MYLQHRGHSYERCGPIYSILRHCIKIKTGFALFSLSRSSEMQKLGREGLEPTVWLVHEYQCWLPALIEKYIQNCVIIAFSMLHFFHEFNPDTFWWITTKCAAVVMKIGLNCYARPVRCQTYGCLPRHRASPRMWAVSSHSACYISSTNSIWHFSVDHNEMCSYEGLGIRLCIDAWWNANLWCWLSRALWGCVYLRLLYFRRFNLFYRELTFCFTSTWSVWCQDYYCCCGSPKM